MTDQNSERDPVEALATEFVERIRRGEHPTVDEYTSRYPALAGKIKDLFPTIAQMEGLKSRNQHSSGAAISLGGPRPDSLGDFHILREIGRGGMGIVYEAEQRSLGRRVAVKVLPRSSLLNPRLLQRFHREAQTASGLHHTNIVPVFGVGEEDQYHFIVMQMISGVGLDTILLHLAESENTDEGEANDDDTASRCSTDERSAEVADAARTLVGSNIDLGLRPCAPIAGETGNQDKGTVSDNLAAIAPTDDFGAKAASTGTIPHDPASHCTGQRIRSSSPSEMGLTFWYNVARIGVQVAGALDYAHERRVLHRDIKPSNLILDQQGVVWVTDFGLAKAMQDDSVSHTGDIVGTLRYMAPERLQGEADARSDIYSLGLTLYEMLALRPAYEASDAGSLLRKIAEDPPPRLLTVATGVPRDLETIVTKALAREPAHRYRSAGDLAEDLQRFLEDRPIHARRVSPVEHVWRWCRRNRVVAGLAAIALALLVLVAVVASIGYLRTNKALAGESQQRLKADQTAQLALEALDDIFEQFAPERTYELTDFSIDDSSGSQVPIPVQPVLSKEAASLLERLLAFYDRLATQGGDDGELRRKGADANRRVGDILAALGQFEQAQVTYLTTIDSYRLIQERAPTDSSISVEIARTYNNLGDLQVPAGSPKASRSFHMQALETLEPLAKVSAAPPALHYEMARTCYALGRSGRPPDLEFGAPPRNAPRPKPPRGGPGPRHDDTRHHENMQYLQHAIMLLVELAEKQPTVPDYQHMLACCYRDLPPTMPFQPGVEQAGQIDRAIEILEKLAEDFPTVPVYRHDLAKTYLHAYSQIQKRAGGTAKSRLHEALHVSQQLVAEHPNVPSYALSQVQVHMALSEMYRRDGRPDDGEQELRKALDLQSSLVARFPDVVPYKVWLATIQNTLGELLIDRERTKEACSLLESATATLREILDPEQEGGHIERLLERGYVNLAELYMQLDQQDLADEMLRQAQQFMRGPKPRARPDVRGSPFNGKQLERPPHRAGRQ